MYAVSGAQPAIRIAKNVMVPNIFVSITYSHFLVSILKFTAFGVGATTLKLNGDLPIADVRSQTLVLV
jgi:hypothetical protein